MSDLISKKKAFEYFVTLWESIGTIMDREEWEDVCMTTANEIPSAQPEKRTEERTETHACDLISRAEAIERIERNRSTWNAHHNNGVDAAIVAVENCPSAEAIQRWIPASEKPKKNGEYIVSLEDSVYPWANFFNGKWFMLSFNGIAREFGEYEVIAWMPLPKPYREDGEA